MKIVVGLGNYPPKYAHTHHNMGFLAVECLAARYGVKFKNKECESLTAKVYENGDTIVLAQPQTLMNLSGVAVKQLLAIQMFSERPYSYIRRYRSAEAGT